MSFSEVVFTNFNTSLHSPGTSVCGTTCGTDSTLLAAGVGLWRFMLRLAVSCPRTGRHEITSCPRWTAPEFRNSNHHTSILDLGFSTDPLVPIIAGMMTCVTNQNLYDCSPANLRVLRRTFWSAAGWNRTPILPEEATFERVKAAGIMFDSDDPTGHDGCVERARSAAQRVNLSDVSDAFLASLTSRRLDLRSALSSYVIARSPPSHSFDPIDEIAVQSRCTVCDMVTNSAQSLNVLNFERFKRGGVRKLDIGYIAFDLEQFERAPKLKPFGADKTLALEIINFIRSCPPSITSSKLAHALSLLPGNKDERATFIGTLGIVGILDTPEFPGFLTRFIKPADRELPSRRFVDEGYPICWWTAANGVNDRALHEVLGLEN